jgi:CNT family concentrative nucleoside transporter
MAAPAALVISKIVWPETQQSETMGKVTLEVKSPYSNVIDAISHGAGDGMKITVNVNAMLIGFLGLIALINFLLMKFGLLLHLDFSLSLEWIFGEIFSPMAWAMGVPTADVANVATMLGKKLTINEFVAFSDLTQTMVPNSAGILVKGYQSILSEKSLIIVSFAICGFANFSSVGMQIGGIGALVPERRADLAKLGMRALLCGTLASYLSATIAGMLMG